MRRMVASLAFALCASVAFARDMPISNGRLVSPLDANQQMITNLPAAFWEGHGGGGVDTNTVKAIIESEVGGTNTLVHSLSPAIAYTTAVSNRFDTAIGSLNSATNDLTAKVEEKRDKTDNVCHTNSDVWTASNVPEDVTMIGTPYVDEGWLMWNASGTVVPEGFYLYVGSEPLSYGSYELSEIGGSRTMIAIFSIIATSGQPYVTYDNVPSTNGLCTVAAAQAMTNDATIVRGILADEGLEWYVSKTITASSGFGFGALDGWDSYWAGGGYETLPDYLASLVWHPSSATLAQYGITDAYTKAQTETASTNAATSVVSNYLDYALMNLTAATLSLRSGEIGNYETTADFTLALSFADNGRSGDCLLYVANTDAAEDHTIEITPNTYKLVSADIVKARTLGKATTNLVMFTRLKSDTVLVSKQEVK